MDCELIMSSFVGGKPMNRQYSAAPVVQMRFPEAFEIRVASVPRQGEVFLWRDENQFRARKTVCGMDAFPEKPYFPEFCRQTTPAETAEAHRRAPPHDSGYNFPLSGIQKILYISRLSKLTTALPVALAAQHWTTMNATFSGTITVLEAPNH